MKSFSSRTLKKLIVDYAVPLLEEQDLVLMLCAYDDNVYFDLPDHWKQNEDALKVVLTSSPLIATHLSQDVQQMYPALVASAVKRLPLSIPDFRTHAECYIHESIWVNHELALAWALAGGNFKDSFPEEFKTMMRIFLSRFCKMTAVVSLTLRRVCWRTRSLCLKL
jgi:hypothetical protein